MKKYIAAVVLSLICLSCEESIPVPEVPDDYVPQYWWKESDLHSQGIDSLKIDSALVEFAADAHLNSLLIVRNGYLVREYYAPPFQFYNEFELRSATKSIVSALIGISLRRGLIDSLDQPMISFFPEYDSPNLDQRAREITVKHLLTMRAGFDYSDNNPTPGLYGPADNWVKQTIELPLITSPGERYNYASVQTHLLSAIIAKRSGMSTLAFCRRYLFDPAGIHIGGWTTDPQGINFGGSGIAMSPRDMARFGYVMLSRGSVDSIPVLTEEWVRQSVTPNNPVNSIWGDFTSLNYGFSWRTNYDDRDSIYFAAGSGGQFIVIVPAKNTVIVTTANPNQSAEIIDQQEKKIIRIIVRYLLTALQ